jgi:predicted nucleic acid-binding protein
MLKGRIYLDANILIELFESDSALSKSLHRLLAVSYRDLILVTSELTLAEVLVLPIRKRDEQSISRYSLFFDSGNFWINGLVNKEVLSLSANIRAKRQGYKLPDAIHLATAYLNGCSHFFTGDRRLFGQIKFNDYEFRYLKHGPKTIDILRPDKEYIETLVASLI